MKKRFVQGDLDAVKQIEKCIILAANNVTTSKDDIAQRLQHFKGLVRFDVLAQELVDLHVHIQLFNKENTTPLKKVTKLSTVCGVLNEKPSSKKCFSEMNKLLQIHCSIALEFQRYEKNQNEAKK